MTKLSALLFVSIALIGCASSKISSMPTSDTAKHSVETIAMMPGGGVLAYAIGIELLNRGFNVVDATSTTNIMARLNLKEVEIALPASLRKLNQQGIDAVLTVRSVGAYDQNVQSASARISSTSTGKLLAGVTWQNGYGGQAGSVADRIMRKRLSEAAREIAENLSLRVTK